MIGVRVPATRKIVAAHWRAVGPKAAVELLASEIHEERLAALLIMVARYERLPEERQQIFDLYLESTNRINNWDLVDSSAAKIVGRHLDHGGRELLDRLAASESLWERRIAILATLHFIRSGQFEDTLRIAESLLDDPEDLIHKACGWMLREVGKRDEATMVAFIESYAPTMPRTMLRYAIERLPVEERQRLMSMD
jgi:3-methyladenine DNA glycosylase AlkD